MNPSIPDSSRRHIVWTATAGLLHGLLYAAGGYPAAGIAQGAPSQLLLEGVLLALILPAALVMAQRALQRATGEGLTVAGNWALWQRIERFALALFAVAGALPGPTLARTLAALAGMLLLEAACAAVLLHKPGRDQVAASEGWIPALFLVSGFAALIYQVVWQRVPSGAQV